MACSACPGSPRETAIRFLEVTGSTAQVALESVTWMHALNVPLSEGVPTFLGTGHVLPAPLKRHAAEGLTSTAKRARLDEPIDRRTVAAPAGASAAAAGPFKAAGAAPKLSHVIPEAEARAAKGLPDGCETHMEGGSGPYKITRRGDVYTCACPAWKNQKLGPFRTCKHIKELRGEEAERRRLVEAGHVGDLDLVRSGLAPGGGGASSSSAAAPAGGAAAKGGKNKDIEKGVMLAHPWDEAKVNPKGYLMSEKLDGMRAVWEAGCLWSRAGNPIAAPAFFLAALPAGIKLDGELFVGRGKFSEVMTICRCTVPNEAAWKRVRYVVFDAPSVKGPLPDRLATARTRLDEHGSNADVVTVHPQVICEGVDHVYRELERVIAFVPPAEGLMLAAPNKPHRGGRCNDILKVKKFHTDDAKVIGHKAGKGRHAGRMGALECVLRTGQRFDVGSGFSDADRDDAKSKYPLGSIVEFRYFEITDAGVPRFPTFLRVRPDVDRAEFP